MKLLYTQDGAIVATGGGIVETDEAFIVNRDSHWGKSLGLQLVEVDSPDDFTPAAYEYIGGALVRKPAPVPPLDRADAARQIDDAVAAVLGRYTRFQVEYERREAQAQAYKDAGYAGPVPPRVVGFAEPAGLTAQAATDLILQQAAQLCGALDQLSDLRMKKNLATRRDSVTGEYVATDSEAQAAIDATLASIGAIAAALG